MRVAIIGGLGFIGRELSRFLSLNGHIIDVYDMIEYLPTSEDRFNYYKINIECDNPSGLRFVDAMIILAARRPYTEFSYEDYEKNVRIAEKCFYLAMINNISNVVFASSKAVYSDQTTMPWKEDIYPSPLSLYGASKVAAEQLSSLYNDNRGMSIKCLRFAQVIGMCERKGYLINTLIDNAIAKKQQIVYGDGSQKRQYIYIKDVCTAILAALERPFVKGVFNIGMQGSVSNRELAECINEVFHNKGNLICDPSRNMGKFNDEMNVEKAKIELGFQVQFQLKDMFADMIKEEGLVREE